MCWYSTLPMIGIGCGIDTDHFMRSGVIGNGDRPIWGMPASLATLDTAIVGGVIDEPMMMSARDSVTKRRALVVAVVGSPPSSMDDDFERGAADLLWHEIKRVALGNAKCRRGARGGNRNADGDFAGLRGRGYGRQRDERYGHRGAKLKFPHSFLPWLFGSRSAAHELRNHLLRDRCGFQPVRIVRMASDQHARLERLDRQCFFLVHLVRYLEARALETLDPAFHRDPVAVGRGDVEFRPRIDDGGADQAVFFDDVLLGKAGCLEQDRCRVVEHLEITRVKDDV